MPVYGQLIVHAPHPDEFNETMTASIQAIICDLLRAFMNLPPF